jgi:hypothetical protein
MSMLREIADLAIRQFIGDDIPGCTHAIVHRSVDGREFWELRSVRHFTQQRYPVLDGPETLGSEVLRSHVERAIGRPVTIAPGTRAGGYCVFQAGGDR